MSVVIGAKAQTTVTPQAAGYEAQGFALAQTVIAECKGIQNTWSRYAAKLVDLHEKARDAFMSELRKHVKQMREHVADKKGTVDHAVYKKAAASAQTQISNLMAVAAAMNAGYVLEIQRDPDTGHPLVSTTGEKIPVKPFYTIVAEARLFNDSQASGRGRPKTPFLDKLKKFILDNQDEFAPRTKEAVELVQAMAELTEMAKKAGEALV